MSDSTKDTFESRLITKVAIVDAYRAGQPFTLKTRRGLANIFAFYGDCEKVSVFM